MLRRALSSLWLIATLCVPAVAEAQSAVDRTHKLIDTFKTVKTAPEGGKLSAADDAANAKTFITLDGFFDFVTFSNDCLGPSASKLSPAQTKEFKERLVSILRKRGYANGGSVFNEGVIKEGKPADRAGATAVPLKISFPKQDVSLDVEFVWNKAGKVVDLVLDGDSLTKDYRNQIAKIISKGGPEDLLKRLADKQKDAGK
jgi:phospholipid transport system substrate-binding protein